MSHRHRWLAGAMAGVVAVAAVVSFAPKPIPAVPPPVRLDRVPTPRTDPSQTELVVVPAPLVDLVGEDPVITSTTVSQSPPPPVTDAPTPGAGAADSPDDRDDPDDDSADDPDDPGDDSTGSMDDSADSPDD
jgi:hypothetical protein